MSASIKLGKSCPRLGWHDSRNAFTGAYATAWEADGAVGEGSRSWVWFIGWALEDADERRIFLIVFLLTGISCVVNKHQMSARRWCERTHHDGCPTSTWSLECPDDALCKKCHEVRNLSVWSWSLQIVEPRLYALHPTAHSPCLSWDQIHRQTYARRIMRYMKHHSSKLKTHRPGRGFCIRRRQAVIVIIYL